LRAQRDGVGERKEGLLLLLALSTNRASVDAGLGAFYMEYCAIMDEMSRSQASSE
jgi:hypothetical protein